MKLCCMWGRGERGNNATCSAPALLSVSSPATHKQIRPFWCWFLGGWACVHSKTLWVSPTNSPVRLGVTPTVSTPTGFYQRFWGFFSPHWNPRLHSLSCSPIVPPGLSACKYGTARSASCHLDHLVLQLPPWSTSSLPQLFISTPLRMETQSAVWIMFLL